MYFVLLNCYSFNAIKSRVIRLQAHLPGLANNIHYHKYVIQDLVMKYLSFLSLSRFFTISFSSFFHIISFSLSLSLSLFLTLSFLFFFPSQYLSLTQSLPFSLTLSLTDLCTMSIWNFQLCSSSLSVYVCGVYGQFSCLFV